ncbi:hypothetical protein BDY19DRAFT_995794 [Irpex rosettiformis]|uniref:Uncharacterized protein n=1 Tax=Irpex rosettiformis TaxID=378272 RepID=A0ACB8TXC5_9APHY|nr:hypothetical protein BDY19DRAFT_995794 [Irpex rosettiformis]
MAHPSTSKAMATQVHNHSRPGLTSKHHTWHGPVTYRSHFEDFMIEIGEDPKQAHLCCMPRQAQRYERTRANSMPTMMVQHSFMQAPSASDMKQEVSRPSPPKGRPVRRQSAPAALATLASFSHKQRGPIPPKLIFANDSSPKVRLPSKGTATVSIDVRSRTPSCLYSIASVSQRLRAAMQVFDNSDRSPLPSGQVPEPDEDQGRWTPLPTSPALVPGNLMHMASSISSRTNTSNDNAISTSTMFPSVHTVSRAPSFASLNTASVSSSEGPATPHSTSSSFDSPVSPTLSYLEHTSRIRVPCVCVTCKRTGANFPSCPSCGDTWCSRECRLADADVGVSAGKHQCAIRTVTTEPAASGSDEVQAPLEEVA